MKPEDIMCASCQKVLLGRGALVVPVEIHEDGQEYGTPLPLHQTCFIEVFDSIFQQEDTAHFEIYIGTVFDLWAGLFTESDEEAGIED